MAKANIETPSGTKIVIEGSSDEISDIISVVRKKEAMHPVKASKNTKKEKSTSATDLISNLREEGFFDKPQGLLEVKKALEEQAHIYPITTLSPLLIRLVRKKILRRLREGKRWVYVKGSG